MSLDATHTFQGVNLKDVRNRNEKRVIEAMRALAAEHPGFCGCRLCIEDVYAAAINSLPAHYVQAGAIVLGSHSTEDEVDAAVRESFAKVTAGPNHPVGDQQAER